jgi:nondiscriminating glutamyl-tRNA synthetase
LHIGGARSALFNYLLAKGAGGDFIMRMEDTDRDRSSPESEENIKQSLLWLGITWNEGIDIGGPHAPYRQTERLATYHEAAQKLLDAGHAYYCYCSELELEAMRLKQIDRGETPHYDGRCRRLSAGERAAKEAEGIKPVLRFAVPKDEELLIEDLVRGQVVFQSQEIGGDFVIIKSDGIPTYNYAVVVDDHLMEISHVVRGEEHLSNTPRQLLLYDALGWIRPAFAHISLILGEDRSKMSKRHGSVSVVNYQAEGYLPQALVNFLALLGWSPAGEEEIFTMQELEQEFSLERVAKNPAVFDLNKLRWLNSQYLRALPKEQIADGIAAFLTDEWTEERRLLLAETLTNHIETFSDVCNFLPLVEGSEPLTCDEDAAAVLAQEHVMSLISSFAAKIETLSELTPATIKETIKQTGKELGLKGAALFMPIRVAITGSCHGPDIDKLAALLGKENLLVRLKHVRK